MSEQQERGTQARCRYPDDSPGQTLAEKPAPRQAVSEIALGPESQVPAQPYQLHDEHQHGNAAGDAVKGPTCEGRRQFIRRVGNRGTDYACEQDHT